MRNSQECRVERVADEVRSYVNMRIDALKLALVENLSVLSGNLMGFVVAGLLVFLALCLFTVMIVMLLELLLNSLIWSLVITAVIYLILAVVVFACREKLFSNRMVGLYSRMFFAPRNKNNTNGYEEENEK